MSNHQVIVCCWLHGHETELFMTKRQEQRLEKQIPELKAVCPICRDEENGNQPIFIKSGMSLFSDHKVYRCRHGHATTISAFTNGMLHVRFGPDSEDFINIEGTIEELENLVDKKEISCHHVKENGRRCDCKLKAVDDASISYPGAAGIKTKVRVGDLWDRHGLEPVRNGAYDNKGNYSESKTQSANMERLKNMRRKRLMKQDKHPGKRINKATKKQYGHRSKSEVNPDKLKGPE